MRRLVLAAVSATLALSACGEQRRVIPTEPDAQAPSAAKATTGSCQSPFPFEKLSEQVGSMFAGSPVLNAATAKLESIASKCANGKVQNAQHLALTFVDWMVKKYRQGELPSGTAAVLADLVPTLFVAVGLHEGDIDPGVFGPRGGAKKFTPGEEFLLRNEEGTAAVALGGDAFDEPTLITLIPLPDDPPQLVNTGGLNQFPPFYDINASNASGTHTIGGGGGEEQFRIAQTGYAVVGFCVDDAVLAQTENPQIGHNPPPEAEVDFEVLPPASAQEYADLGLTCDVYGNDPGSEEFGVGLDLSGSLKSLARSIFLPPSLHATALVGTGLGGRTSTLSPFGVVDFTENELSIMSDPSEPDADSHYFKGAAIDLCQWPAGPPFGEPCPVTVQILNDGTPAGVGTAVTASLISVEVATGADPQLIGENPQIVESFISGEETIIGAAFEGLGVSEPGKYKLMFSAPGATSVTSEEFDVYTLAFTLQPTAEPGQTISQFQALGQPLAGFEHPVVQVSMIDYDNQPVSGASDFIRVKLSPPYESLLDGTDIARVSDGVVNYTEIVSIRSALRVRLGDICTEEVTEVTGLTLTTLAPVQEDVVQDTSTPFNVSCSD